MPAFSDARRVPHGATIETDLAIVGGGPAGISLALALAHTKMKVLLLESGGMDFDAATQALYQGTQSGTQYLTLDGSRLRYFGGSTNHWGGWTRPLDESDFLKRDWLPYSGWPFPRKELEPYFPRAQALVEAGAWVYDGLARDIDPPLKLGKGGVYTSFFQFSQWRGNPDHLPTHFGERYADDLGQIANLNVMLEANVTGVRLTRTANAVDGLDVATLSGNRFAVKPRFAVLAMGAMEVARLMLASDDVMKTGVGNQNGLVGRFFADHAIPRDVGTLVTFDGTIPDYYVNNGDAAGAHFRAALSPSEAFKAARKLTGSLTTIENNAALDEGGRAIVTATAEALGANADNAKAFSLGVGFELAPDPARRLTLSGARDALGMRRLKLHMTLGDEDIARYRETLKELGRQLLAARTGMLRLNYATREQWLSVIDWADHHMGTTRMHDDPKQGVVDANSKVHGIDNLFVAGSSVFPTYGASNPTMNLLALVLRLAERLKQVVR